MSTALKVLLGVGLLGLIFAGGLIATVVGVNNQFVSYEEGIKAQYKQNQNNYDNMWKKFKEITQVADMYAGDLKKVYDSALQGRYGADGSKAVFQWIQEQNPNLDPSLYKQIQQAIEAGRNSFEANQKTLLDKKRVYETELRQFPGGFIAGFMGFPKIDLDKYDIVTSDETEKAFETKKSGKINLRD